jgi:hypothetical protein
MSFGVPALTISGGTDIEDIGQVTVQFGTPVPRWYTGKVRRGFSA